MTTTCFAGFDARKHLESVAFFEAEPEFPALGHRSALGGLVDDVHRVGDALEHEGLLRDDDRVLVQIGLHVDAREHARTEQVSTFDREGHLDGTGGRIDDRTDPQHTGRKTLTRERLHGQVRGLTRLSRGRSFSGSWIGQSSGSKSEMRNSRALAPTCSAFLTTRSMIRPSNGARMTV